MIKIIISVAVLMLFGFTLDTHPLVDPPHWNPSWPMFENGTYEKCWIGYGDWCIKAEGPHPGLDFDDPSGGADSVLAPNNFPAYSGYVFQAVNPIYGWKMCFLLDKLVDSYGWGIGHLEIQYPNDPPFAFGSPISSKQLITHTQPTSGQHSWRHIHLSWIPKLDPPPTGEFVGLFNPFDYLQAPSGYDETSFWHIPYVDNNNQHGLWFTWDKVEKINQFPGGGLALHAFQSRVYGQVDIVARPYSHPVGSPYETKCGVRSVSSG